MVTLQPCDAVPSSNLRWRNFLTLLRYTPHMLPLPHTHTHRNVNLQSSELVLMNISLDVELGFSRDQSNCYIIFATYFCVMSWQQDDVMCVKPQPLSCNEQFPNDITQRLWPEIHFPSTDTVWLQGGSTDPTLWRFNPFSLIKNGSKELSVMLAAMRHQYWVLHEQLPLDFS